MELNNELKQYYQELRKGIKSDETTETNEMTEEQRLLWEKHLQEMRKLKESIEGIPEMYKSSDKIEIRVMPNEK